MILSSAIRDGLSAGPRLFPGTSFAFLPADMVSQILNFGVPAPIDVQIVGNDITSNRKYADEVLSKLRLIPGVADARIQQAFQTPTLNVNVSRTFAGMVAILEQSIGRAEVVLVEAGVVRPAPSFIDFLQQQISRLVAGIVGPAGPEQMEPFATKSKGTVPPPGRPNCRSAAAQCGRVL